MEMCYLASTIYAALLFIKIKLSDIIQNVLSYCIFPILCVILMVKFDGK